jgi:glycosyltransferase involved in cell wall biosynthesis
MLDTPPEATALAFGVTRYASPPYADKSAQPMSVSVLILTLNEEINLAACLESLSWSNDIVVLDSLSVDRTKSIAEAHGARVVERPFDNWSAHQNWAVKNISFSNPWVLYLDADERCDDELRDEVVARAQATSHEAAFRIRRKDFFMGRWLKHAQLYPTWLVRLFRPEKIHYERLVNPVAIVDGLIGDLQSNIIHFPFSHGVAHWIARHNRYSDMEALEALRAQRSAQMSASIFSRDPNMRRRAMKDVFFRLPGRPLLRFLYSYVFRRGFLDGRAGFTYAVLMGFYEYLIVCKTRELIRKEAGLPL